MGSYLVFVTIKFSNLGATLIKKDMQTFLACVQLPKNLAADFIFLFHREKIGGII